MSEQEGASKSPSPNLICSAQGNTRRGEDPSPGFGAQPLYHVPFLPRTSLFCHEIVLPGSLALTSPPPPSWHPAPPDPMYLSSWASQPRAGRRRYLSSSQSPWRPGARSSSRVSYTFLGAEAAGAEPPAPTSSGKLAHSRVGRGEGRTSRTSSA